MGGMWRHQRLELVRVLVVQRGPDGITLPELAAAMGLKYTGMIKSLADEVVARGDAVRVWDDTTWPVRYRYYGPGVRPAGEERTGRFLREDVPQSAWTLHRALRAK